MITGHMKKSRHRRLKCEIHHHYHITNISDVSNSVILAHNHGNNTVSLSNSGQLTEQETEMLRLFRSFDMRRKTEAIACLFKIEDRIKEAALNG